MNNKRRVIIGILGFITVITVQIVTRMFFASDLQYEINLATVSDHFYDVAYIKDNGLIYSDYSTLRGFYLVLLSCAFRFFGNLDSVIIFYNMALELIALIFIYFALRNIFGRLFSFILSLIVAAYPAIIILAGTYTGTIYMLMWREDRLLYLAGAVGLWLISLIVSAIKKSVKAKKNIASDKAVESETAGADEDSVSDESVKTDESDEIIDLNKEDEGGDVPQADVAETTESASVEPVKTPEPVPDVSATTSEPESAEPEPASEPDPRRPSVYDEEPSGHTTYMAPTSVDYSTDEPDRSITVVLSEEGMVVEEYKTRNIKAVLPTPQGTEEIVNIKEVSKPVELLKMPLPGPKKHEHRDMDYDYQVDPSQMKYDIDTDDESDYDYE